VLEQSHTKFELTLLDDGSSDEYRDYVESLGDRRVRYHRNARRLGAMDNMFQAIGHGTGKYTLAFHEDDVLECRYLEIAVGILERDPGCGFVSCQLRAFESIPPMIEAPGEVICRTYTDSADFLRGVLKGAEPMFGSVIYRREALAGITPLHEAYATLVDRPFLLSVLKHWRAALVTDPPLVWYRRHSDGDGRHQPMTAQHIMRLFETYRATLPQPLSAEDAAMFHEYSGAWLLTLYDLLPPQHRIPLRAFLFEATRRGLYGLRSIKRSGRKRVVRSLILNTNS
jgi:hypothetical protein